MTNRRKQLFFWSTVIGAGLVLVQRLWAAGIPSTSGLTYTGMLEDASGFPLSGTPTVQVYLWTAPMAGANPLCLTQSVTANGGRFSAPFQDSCTKIIHENPDIWSEVRVDGTSLGFAKLGAVPYAVESQNAVSATTAQNAIGDITPSSVTVNGTRVINAQGQWVGPNFGMMGPPGPEGPPGPQGPTGPPGPLPVRGQFGEFGQWFWSLPAVVGDNFMLPTGASVTAPVCCHIVASCSVPAADIASGAGTTLMAVTLNGMVPTSVARSAVPTTAGAYSSATSSLVTCCGQGSCSFGAEVSNVVQAVGQISCTITYQCQ